jgi:two-component system chemotaxis response regulator CheY
MTPKNRLPADEPPALPLERQLNSRQRILVVDDDGDIRRVNTEVLVDSGYEVDAAADGALAWDILQFKHYDLLVTDYNMPKMSGVDLLLKLHAAGMDLPVILVSGTIPWEKLKRHPWLQIDATLLKPYIPDELLAAVEKVLCATDAISRQTATLPH